MNRSLCFVPAAVLLMTACCTSCTLASYGLYNFFGRSDTVRSRAESMTELSAPAASSGGSSYTVAVITDVHYGSSNSRSVDTAFISWLDGLNTAGKLPRFVICLGDVAEHGYESEMKDFNALADKVRAYGIQVYSVLGNHDLYNDGWQYWKEIVYPGTSFYHFKTDGFSWYFLDTGNGTLGTHQYSLLIDALQKDSSPKIVCMHYPVYAQGHFYFCLQDTTERNLLISYFADNNVKLLLDGHTHDYNYTDFGFVEYNIPGFAEDGQWALVTIDESAGTAVPALVSE